MPVLKKELAQFMQEYNAYSALKQKYRLCPPGIPEDNFRFPERLGRLLLPLLITNVQVNGIFNCRF